MLYTFMIDNIFKYVIICVAFSSIHFSCSNSGSMKNSTEFVNIIIPQPTSFLLSKTNGFSFENSVQLFASDSLDNELKYLQTLLADLNINTTNNSNSKAKITLSIKAEFPINYHQISCKENEINIYGGGSESLFNGIQSLNQTGFLQIQHLTLAYHRRSSLENCYRCLSKVNGSRRMERRYIG